MGIGLILYRLLGLYSFILLLYCVLSFLPGLDNAFTRIVRSVA